MPISPTPPSGAKTSSSPRDVICASVDPRLPRPVATISSVILVASRPASHSDAVLAAVKEWPGDVGASGEGKTTAILDGGCARRQRRGRSGRRNGSSGRTKKQLQGSQNR